MRLLSNACWSNMPIFLLYCATFFSKRRIMNLTNYRNVVPLVLMLLASTYASARGKHPVKGIAPQVPAPKGMDFVENKGQWVPEARYRTGLPGGVVFITNHGFVYNYVSTADLNTIHEK